MHEALLYQRLPKQRVRCLACAHHCLIAPGQKGFCQVRKNVQGRLYSLNYAKVIAEHIDPIEKKPLFHFLPAHLSYSLATVGCNFRCLHCQNYEISQWLKADAIPGDEVLPDQIIERAKKNHCLSIAYTYTEPTIYFEYAFDIMKLAKKQGLKNIWVSNGFFSSQLLDLIFPYLDAINVDLKFFQEKSYQEICQAHLAPILDNLKRLAKSKVHLEVTTLIIPRINDSVKELTQIAKFIKTELGEFVPWHISAFFPAFKMIKTAPTSLATIQAAYQIGLQIGLKYVYAGNINDFTLMNSYCPFCQALLIKRQGYLIEFQDKRFANSGRCSKCGNQLKGWVLQ